MKFREISLLFALLIIGQSSLFAQQALDIITFGNTSSENSHSLTAAYSTTYTGQLSQTARSFNPRTDATSYVLTGNTYGIYGGYCTFKVAVSKTEQNYFSVKMSGDEFDSHQDLENGRILLSVQGTDGGFYEIGRRSGDGESVFIDQSGNAILPGTFWYRTSAIPRKFTTGKDSIVLRLKASGRFYSYGTIWNYNTYQRALLYPTVGVYKGFSHTNPMFTLPAADLKGTSKMTYTKASTASKLSGNEPAVHVGRHGQRHRPPRRAGGGDPFHPEAGPHHRLGHQGSGGTGCARGLIPRASRAHGFRA